MQTAFKYDVGELKKLSDDMMLSADPLGKIKDLQSRLTAAETRVKELEKCERRMNWILANKCSFYYQSLTVEDVDKILRRAELDKLKGTK